MIDLFIEIVERLTCLLRGHDPLWSAYGTHGPCVRCGK